MYQPDDTFVKEAKSLIKVYPPSGHSTKHLVLKAYIEGYRVTPEGILLDPDGNRVHYEKYYKSPYPHYPKARAEYKGSNYSFKVHWLAAICFFGVSFLEQNVCVCHENGDVMDISRNNIKIGTQKENMQNKLTRFRIALQHMKSTPAQINLVIKLNKEGYMKRDIAQLVGIPYEVESI